MKQLKTTSLFFLLTLSLTSCNKDKLIDDLASFKGRYTWQYTQFKEHWYDSEFTTRDADQSDYTAEILFNDEGKLFFYINNKEIHKTGFSVENTETIGSTVSLKIKPAKKNSKNLKLEKYIELTLTDDTLLSIGTFPSKSYDDSFFGTHYFFKN